MAEPTKPQDYSTYARIIMTLSSFGNLFNPNQADSTKIVGIPDKVITNQQIKRILDDPINQDIKTVMRAEAAKVEMARNIKALEEQVQMQKIFIRESLAELSPKKNISKPEEASLASSKAALENQYRKLNNIEQSLQQNYAQLSKLENEVNTIAKNQEIERDKFRKSTLKDVSDGFDKLNLSGKKFLNEDEVTELLRVDSWDEIVKRFKQLNVDWPKHIDKKNPSYSAYFELKSFLAIRSALSRNFLPHDNDNVTKHMKQLTDVFKKAAQQGEEMYKKQEQISNELIKNEVKPILESLKSNLTSLDKMQKDNENLVKAIAPSQVEVIQQRTKSAVASIEPEKSGPRR